MNVLEAKGISKSFDGVKIIENISLFVKEGEIVSLLGVSGVGKSTLFNIMAGLEKPDAGEVYLEGESVTGKSGLIGYMQQSDLLLPFKTVVKNVMIPLVLSGTDKKAAEEKALEMLREFSLEDYAHMYPGALSGGMRQRVALARTFLYGKGVVLMDEPFSALDAITRDQMQQWFKREAEKHSIAALLVTHDVEEAVKLSDRIYVLGQKGAEEFENNGDKDKLKKAILEKVK